MNMGQKTVLIVDDDRYTAEWISILLRWEGFDTLTCTSGRQAVQLLQTGKYLPDIIITAIVMTSMSGQKFICSVREMRFPCPIIAIGYQEVIDGLDNVQERAYKSRENSAINDAMLLRAIESVMTSP